MPSEMMTTPKYLEQEETLSQEFKDFLSTLPKQKGWLAAHLYQYQGFWYPVRHLHGVTSCQKLFQSHPDDILLVSTPKSGTTWLKAILFSLVNRTRHHPKTHPLLSSNPHHLLPFLELSYSDNRLPDFSSYSSPRLFSTHLPHVSLPHSLNLNATIRIVYLCRDPKDIFVSLWHFCNRLKPQQDPANSIAEVFDLFCRGVTLFGPCWDHALGYWKQYVENPERVLFLRFEELKEKPGVELRRLSEFLGFPFSAAEEESGVPEEILRLCSFDSLSGMEVNRSGKLPSGEDNKVFFRRGVVGDWKNYLDAEMAEKFDRIAEEKFRGSGLML